MSWLTRGWRRAAAPGGSVATNAAIVAAAFAFSRVLGMVREVVIAARFGTGATYDAYVAAFRIPDLLFALLISGAFGSAFIPVFGSFLAREERQKAWRLANTLLTWSVAALAIVAVAIIVFARPLIDTVIAPDLPPGGRELAVRLTRLLLLSPLLLGLGAAAKGMLEAQEAFTLPAIAPLLYNLGIIAGAVVLVPAMGIYGLAVGVIAGAGAHMAIQFLALLRGGLRLRPSLARDTEGLGAVLRLMGPRVVGQGASQANLIVMINFASRLGEGSISALNYANQLVLLPLGVFAMSLSTVIFPRMARQFAGGRPTELRRTLVDGLGPLLFLILPATVALAILRTSIVQVIFQYGSFDGESTRLVANAVALLALGLPGRSLIEPISRGFYAMHDTRTPVIISVAAVAANIGLSWWLSARFGFSGLALSLSLTYTARMLALLVILSSRTGGMVGVLGRALTRMAPPVVTLALASLLIAEPLARLTDPAHGRGPADYLTFVAALAGLGAVYLGTAWALRTPELRAITAVIQHRRADTDSD